MAADSAEQSYIVTTRPLIPHYSEHPTFFTENPYISARPFRRDDLVALHELRTQIEVMRWTSTGRIDASLDDTKTWMNRFMELEQSIQSASSQSVEGKIQEASVSQYRFNFAIVYTRPPSGQGDITELTSEVIGAGGCHVFDPEPELGYMIRKEYWGQGVATVFVKAFLAAYWSLERTTVRVPIQDDVRNTLLRRYPDALESTEPPFVPEYVKGIIDDTNAGSRRVLEKCGFQYLSSRPVEENGETMTLAEFILDRP